ncbi:MAG: phosphotransferase [Planctomycetota bacterium]
MHDRPSPYENVKGLLEVYVAKSKDFRNDVQDKLPDICEDIGDYIKRSVGQLGLDVLGSLSRNLLRAETFVDRLKNINIAATRATSWRSVPPDAHDTPDGAYSHIRRYFHMAYPGYQGMLRMISNDGYRKDVAHISEGLRRYVPAGTWSEITNQMEEEAGANKEQSVSVKVFADAYARYDGEHKKDLKQLEARIAEHTIIEMIKGDYATIGARGETRSQMTVPILDGSLRPIGVLNINSDRYAWINPLWLPTAIELAKRAALVIESESGYALVRREKLTLILPDDGSTSELRKKNDKHVELEIIPDRPESLKKRQLHRLPPELISRLLELYANEAVYKKIGIDSLVGFSPSTKTFKVKIYDRHDTESVDPINNQVVRFFPDIESADRELQAYEFYVEPYLSPRYYCTKLEDKKNGSTAAISYAWAAHHPDDEALTIEEKVSSRYGKCLQFKDKRSTTDGTGLWEAIESFDKAIATLYDKVLEPWHSAGEGAFANDDVQYPSLIDLYEKDRGQLSPPSEEVSDADIFDTQITSLYSLAKVQAKVKLHGTASESLLKEYQGLKEAVSEAVGTPTLGICHGDLNLRNILGAKESRDPSEIWIIDFDHCHRGHVYQDFARLETYVVDLFLNKLNQESKPDDKLNYWRLHLQNMADTVLGEVPGKIREVDEKLYEKVKISARDHIPLWFCCMLSLITSVRKRAYLFRRWKKEQEERQYCLEYYFALLGQYLDWISHESTSKLKGKDKEYSQDCERLSTIANWMAIEPLTQLLKGN